MKAAQSSMDSPISELPRTGRWCWLRPLADSDAEYIYRCELSGTNLTQYRFSGNTPSNDQLWSSFFQNTVSSFVLCRSGNSTPIGTIVVFDPDYRNGHAKLAAALYEAQGGAWAIEGFALALDYTFNVFPFRKLYLDILEFNLSPILSIAKSIGMIEATLKKHHYLDGVYWDLYTISIFREDWNENKYRFIAKDG